jgi:hypothetical protein
MRLPSQVAIVTGGASGISLAVANRFVAEGTSVMLADNSETAGMEAVEQIRAAGGRTQFARLDVSKADEVKHVVERTIAEFGDLHILFNGAGILTYGTVLETTEEAWPAADRREPDRDLSLLEGRSFAHGGEGTRRHY